MNTFPSVVTKKQLHRTIGSRLLSDDIFRRLGREGKLVCSTDDLISFLESEDIDNYELQAFMSDRVDPDLPFTEQFLDKLFEM